MSMEFLSRPERQSGKRTIKTAALLGGIAIATPVVLGLVDQAAGNLKKEWQNPEAEMTFGGEVPRGGEDTWICLPAHGVQSSQELAEVLSERLGVSTVGVQLPYKQASLEKVGQKLEEFITENDIENVSFYNHSTGGVMMCELLPYLPHWVKINNIAFDCSPTSIEDAHSAGLGKAVGRSGFTGGPVISRLVAATRLERDPGDDRPITWGERWQAGRDRVGPNGGSTSAWRLQLRMLCNADYEFMESVMSERLSLDTKLYYIMPGDPNSDRKVKVPQAASRWGELARREITVVKIPNGGHAASHSLVDAYVEEFSKILNQQPQS